MQHPRSRGQRTDWAHPKCKKENIHPPIKPSLRAGPPHTTALAHRVLGGLISHLSSEDLVVLEIELVEKRQQRARPFTAPFLGASLPYERFRVVAQEPPVVGRSFERGARESARGEALERKEGFGCIHYRDLLSNALHISCA